MAARFPAAGPPNSPSRATAPHTDEPTAPRADHQVAAQIGVLELERIAARGWQATSTAVVGDWLLRAGGGFTGRANSVLPLGSPGMTIGAALAEVEQFYRGQGLPPLFQIPRCDQTAELEAFLDDRGWDPFNPTMVLVADVRDAADRCPPVQGWPPAVFEPGPSADWLARYTYRGSALPPSAAAILQNAEPVVFGSVVLPGVTGHPAPERLAAEPDRARHRDVVAVVRGALTDGWLGVTALTVDPSRRRSGAGRHLMGELLRWADCRGARHCYLQVAADNEAALQLYSRLGFSEHHRYHYRRRATP